MDEIQQKIESDKAERITKEMLHEEASLWYISDSYGSKVMVKVPFVAIKALIKGCRIEFLFGKDTEHHPPMFHAGVRIYDDPVHYVSVTGIQRFIDEHTSLENIMSRSNTYIHFHNELNICVATATISFELEDQMTVLRLLGNPNALFIGNCDGEAAKSLDCFDYTLGIDKEFKDVHKIETFVMNGHISGWQMMENTFIGVNQRNTIVADDPNEGEVLERQVWVSLEALFDRQLFRNPKVSHKGGFRELTDVFAFSDFGIFLIETKAMGVLNTNGRTMERKVKGLQQQIEKAINQLAGAAKKITEKACVFDVKGNEISFNKDILPHCVVLVSELLPFGDWKDIELKMLVAMTETKMYLNVMDVKEFMRYVGISKGSKDKLDYLLMERTKSFVEHGTIHLKIREIPPESGNTE